MARLVGAVLALLAIFGVVPQVALSQTPGLPGAWSWASPGNGGSDYNTILLNGNGTFVRVSRAPNGMLLRYEGVYRVASTGPNQLVMQSRVRSWYPSAMCSQISSMGIRNCVPVPHPGDSSAQFSILSPTAMQTQGITLSRDGNPYLLNARVPAQMVREEAAPAQPGMPALHPYVTPNGPGMAISRNNHQNAQDFINNRLRGCYKDEQGRLWGCQQ